MGGKVMARINLQKFKEDDEIREKDYCWKKPLILCGKIFPQPIRGKEYYNGQNREKYK